ncbi:MAG: hypothetical protein ACR2OG_12000 [Gemmatimonadaceae bacterium]
MIISALLSHRPGSGRALALVIPLAAGCASSPSARAQAPSAVAVTRVDTTGADLVQPGFGTLRQEQIAISVQLQSIQVRAIPLDEGVIRLLSPDSYRAMRALVEGKRDTVAVLSSRHNLRNPSLWYISFYGVEPDARFSPQEIVIISGGRDYRPVEILPLSSGFGEQRVRQREVQSAIYIFDGDVNVGQPLTLSVEAVQSNSWQNTLQTIDRERTSVRSRAAKKP